MCVKNVTLALVSLTTRYWSNRKIYQRRHNSEKKAGRKLELPSHLFNSRDDKNATLSYSFVFLSLHDCLANSHVDHEIYITPVINCCDNTLIICIGVPKNEIRESSSADSMHDVWLEKVEEVAIHEEINASDKTKANIAERGLNRVVIRRIIYCYISIIIIYC